MHRLLNGQLERFNLDQNNPPDLESWQEILEQIDITYKETDRDRNLLEYSLTMSSREMQELYDNLQQSTEKHIAQLVGANEKLLEEIVERERAEEALRKSKEKYQTITDQRMRKCNTSDKQKKGNEYLYTGLA